MRAFGFEKLTVWHKAKDLVLDIYRMTREFPKEELYTMTSQLRRAAISIPSNLAEGTSRKTNRDKAHFTTVAFSSLMEVANQLIISYELGYMSEEDYLDTREKIQEVGRMLNALRNAQEKE
jgi:four helix bundle protein